jgi:Asp-tRNA(Asn)/Glu-tRNA(Gln) amidotransferase A subunit family amidase
VKPDEYLRHDAHDLARLVADGSVTPAELLDAARARAALVEPQINAICRRMDPEADARAAQVLSGPFAGVPFLLKDLHQDVAGVPTSSGCRALAERPAPLTSTVVERWLAAGLVVFGKTSTPEFGAKGVTEPELFGPTRNPWDTSRTPGGSSGGSAAAVAAGIVPVAGASDGGGSIRIPAACTGLFGLKAGRGLIPHGPATSEPLLGMATQGVVSRSVRDSAAMLDVLAGSEAVSPFDPAVAPDGYAGEVGREPGRLRIGYSAASALRDQPDAEAVRAVEDAAALLEELGHEVEEVEPSHDDAQAARDFLTIWRVHQAWQVDRVKRLTGAGDDEFEQDTLILAALGRATAVSDFHLAQERRNDHVLALASLHETHDLLLTPALGEPPIEVGSLDTPWPARLGAEILLRTRTAGQLRHVGVTDAIIEQSLAWVPYTQLANLTGRPAISVPLHCTETELPLGVQFVGRLGSEPTLLRLAAQLEEARPWAGRRPPLG